MSWPLAAEYVDLVQHPATAFLDPELRSCSVGTDNMGLPQAYSGNFAVAFRLNATRATWAVRCFTRQVTDVQRRYDAISRFCDANPDPALCFFEYQARGIIWSGTHLPIVKMEWAEGETLGKWLTQYYSDSRALRRVAEGIAQIADRLERRGTAHGDLQHGNLMITAGLVRLIDYDGMFVPDLQGLDSPVLGHRNYQHPARTAAQFDARMDRFSILVMFIGLTALAADGTRFVRHGCDERILFERRDFENPDESDLFHELTSDPTVGNWALALAEACRRPPAACPTLAEVLDGSYLAKIGPVALARKTTVAPRPPTPSAPPPRPQAARPQAPPPWQARAQQSSPQAPYSAMPGSAVPFVQANPLPAKRSYGGVLVAASFAVMVLATVWHPWSPGTHNTSSHSTSQRTVRTTSASSSGANRALHATYRQKQRPAVAKVVAHATKPPRIMPHASIPVHQAAVAVERSPRAERTEADVTAAHDIESMALGAPRPTATEASGDISDVAQRRSAAVCATPNDEAVPVQLASPDAPESLHGASASAAVRVALDASGHVVGTSIVRSTGDSNADAAALAAARASTFRPGHRNCEAVAGEYLVTFDFE